MNDIAKAYWDKAVAHQQAAEENTDINASICYATIAESALKMAQFAVNNPFLVAGIDEYAPPEVPKPGPDSPVPQAPTQGPKFWGAP